MISTAAFRSIAPLLALLVPAAAGLAAGCDGGTTSPDPTCTATPFQAQARSRFVIGQTFYLPVADAGGCGDAEWKLDSAPAGNENVLVKEEGGITRFTPTVPGAYSFVLGDTGVKESFTAISADGLPFHNLNYFPGSSIAAVDGEIWTADIYSPTLHRRDAATLKDLGRIDVGPWPVALAWTGGMTHAVVAQRGGDTLGLVDVATGRLVDAIWVGDEPSNVVVSPDGQTAYVTLATESAVAIVDLATRSVRARVATGNDPRAMALGDGGKALYVASFRSGHPSRTPYEADPVEEEQDITVIDTQTGTVTTVFLDVGDTLQGLLLSEDGAKLYVSSLRGDTSVAVNDTTTPAFSHLVTILDAKTGEKLASADLSRQDTSGGLAVSVHGMALQGGKLWVVAEGSDVAVALDPETLAEVSRVQASGRPRALTSHGGALFVHGAQSFGVTRIGEDGAASFESDPSADPRPELVASGLRGFTGSGDGWGENSTCNSCHADGLTDTLVWRTGPTELYEVPRPQFWLEGTPRLGWPGYVSTVANFAFAGQGTVGVRPTTAQFEGANAYLASLMPPPAANGKTLRDGSLSEAALRGKEIYEGKGACTACHALPTGTSKDLLSEGVTGGLTDVPSLVGAYRHGVWLKHGEARDLRTAVVLVLEWLGNSSLSDAEIDDLTRYLEELTARDFFVLASEPSAGEKAAAADMPIRLTMSQPVFDDGANLAAVTLLDEGGAVVPAKVEADGRFITITPDAMLEPAKEYKVSVAGALESLDETRLAGEASVSFTTAAKKEISLEGAYLWNIAVPVLDLSKPGGFDPDVTVTATVLAKAEATEAGARLILDYGQDLQRTLPVVIDGKTLLVPPLGVPAGPSFADAAGLTAELVDSDGDGVADSAAGKLTMTGPGILVPDIAWELVRDQGDVCNVGASGDVAVSMTTDAGVTQIDWGTDPALALYVTSPGAVLPMGPGKVTNGTTYWSLATASFPSGFLAPVTYGVVPAGANDSTAMNDGVAGGTPLVAGTCYKVSVVTTSFKTGQVVLLLE